MTKEISLTITLETEPEVRAAILDGLRSFNRLYAEAPDFSPIALAARKDRRIVGGLVGETGWKWLHVELLWVTEEHRGKGLGRRLLRAAEHEAVQRGAHHAFLDTFDFQARPFYEREGYVVFGTQTDYPPGHSRFYMRKPLVAP